MPSQGGEKSRVAWGMNKILNQSIEQDGSLSRSFVYVQRVMDIVHYDHEFVQSPLCLRC